MAVPLPDDILRQFKAIASFADDIMLWAMELDQGAELYGLQIAYNDTNSGFITANNLFSEMISLSANQYTQLRSKQCRLVFIVEPEFLMMFMLRWGATKYKYNPKDVEFF